MARRRAPVFFDQIRTIVRKEGIMKMIAIGAGVMLLAGLVRACQGWRRLLRQLPDRNEDMTLF
ncbi:hypothetical protein FYA99_00500 [Bordetella parapertussis]|uniref:Exported protein n=3 Tax=Bordetella TaxID=517 RepID=Q7W296_BORPA|nr:hypothetical protein BBB43_00495 [Bordetella parapertussis]AWP73016.1 hypothetical protein B7P10_00495 [Bordetella bronchiseptica]KCV35266.1 hypothetical protein L490_4947 [Bordetella bronchiseptica 00-P-2796]KDB65973.1 hypothetical protein AZ15_0081 [Bordetella bronchiseptica A1-7]KDB71291.1 hypothetical protein AZ21_0093 [Bordetella bronchiseptica B20-10725633]KDB96347.1 hypothetical protein AZ23_0176 [Bordetella bronchiseptica E010]KDC03150.1 hypothetical protein AZ19_0102 [Bordetella b